MVEKTVIVVNKTGLHARPASQLTNLAKQFKSKILLVHQDNIANCKSIINILTCNLCQGSEVLVRAEGEDEDEALKAVTELIENFNE